MSSRVVKVIVGAVALATGAGTAAFGVSAPIGTPDAGRRVADGASVSQTFTVPASGKFSFAGHGFGHGHGMSQYGAEGAARKGLTYQQILAFYYPHTALKRTSGKIRVLITADTSRDLKIVAQKGLRVVDRRSGKSYALPYKKRINKWRLTVRHRRTIVQFHTKAWHRYRVGKKKLGHLKGVGEFRARSGRLTLITPSGRAGYRGALRAAAPKKGSTDRDTVNVLSIGKYVRGVVPREMPTSWHAAAVRAQAVAARTYALFERAEFANRYYQICDTTSCQVYGGLGDETSGGNAAVKATAGRYLAYKGGPAFTQFSASSGGWTSDGGKPYLPAQADPYDDWSGNYVHSWSVAANASVLERRFPALGTLEKITITSRTGGGQWQGRVLTATLTGTAGSVDVTGSDIAGAYGLRSTWFMPARP